MRRYKTFVSESGGLPHEGSNDDDSRGHDTVEVRHLSEIRCCSFTYRLLQKVFGLFHRVRRLWRLARLNRLDQGECRHREKHRAQVATVIVLSLVDPALKPCFREDGYGRVKLHHAGSGRGCEQAEERSLHARKMYARFPVSHCAVSPLDWPAVSKPSLLGAASGLNRALAERRGCQQSGSEGEGPEGSSRTSGEGGRGSFGRVAQRCHTDTQSRQTGFGRGSGGLVNPRMACCCRQAREPRVRRRDRPRAGPAASWRYLGTPISGPRPGHSPPLA